MKRWNYYLVFLLGISFSLFSCSSSEEEALPWFDFGEATYDEPFVGLLKSRPEFLVKSMRRCMNLFPISCLSAGKSLWRWNHGHWTRGSISFWEKTKPEA